MNPKKLAKLLVAMQGDKTQAWLAKEIGVTQSRLGTYLRCEIKDVSVEFLGMVAKYKGMDVGELIEMISDKKRPLKAGEASQKYSVSLTTFEDLEAELSQLSQKDAAKAINYLSGRMIAA